MKRIHKLFILALTLTISFLLPGCADEQLELVSSYELIAAKVDSKTQVQGDISGAYLLGFGEMSGNIETASTQVYYYWYKREDGGIIPDKIDMSSYKNPEHVKIVIYENDAITPKVEVWEDSDAQHYGVGSGYSETEFRFTIPSGSFVNTFDLQGLTVNSQ